MNIIRSKAPLTISAFLATLAPLTANATMQWSLLGGNGCATSIAVAPNNVPWVIGCDNAADKGVYYLQYPSKSSCTGVCVPQPTWFYNDGAGVSVSTDYEGNVYVVNSSGAVYAAGYVDAPTCPGLPCTSFPPAPPTTPTGQWGEISPNSNNHFVGGDFPNPGGCITALAVTANGDINEAFVTPKYLAFGGPNPYYYGIGCSSSADTNIFVYSPRSGVLTWSQVDEQDNAVASQIVLFDQSPPTGLIQTPWILKSDGSLSRYNGVSFEPVPSLAGTFAMTDHFIAAYATLPPQLGGVSEGVFQWNDETQGWQSYVDLFTPEGTKIVQLAYSGLFYSSIGPVGPSQLWGIDQNGAIYFATDVDKAQ